jgi:predicted phosphodiesterase
MRIGVISDPHGCLVGLEATLDWLDRRGVDAVVCAGDVANFGPQPNACITLLAERSIPTIQGNSDRDMLLPPQAGPQTGELASQLAAINAWSRARLTPASRRWLAALPPRLQPAPGLLVVHGGLDDPEEIVKADANPSFPPGVSVVAAGHLHAPFVLRTRQGIWVNAGSAGRSCDGDPRAALALLELLPNGWQASIHRVPFDLEAAARAIRKAGMPYADRLIETQRAACWWRSSVLG